MGCTQKYSPPKGKCGRVLGVHDRAAFLKWLLSVRRIQSSFKQEKIEGGKEGKIEVLDEDGLSSEPLRRGSSFTTEMILNGQGSTYSILEACVLEEANIAPWVSL